MKRGRLLSPDEVRLGQEVILVPSGDISRGPNLGDHPEESLVRCSEAHHSAARRGAVELYAVLEERPAAPTDNPQPEEH